MKTDFETLKMLANFMINHLKEHNLIEFDVEKRVDLIDSLATECGVSFATDEDIKVQAIEDVEEKMGLDSIPEDIAETEMYNHARKEIIKSFSGENIAGLYLVESLRSASERVNKYLSDSDLIIEVFGTDEEVIDFLVKKIRTFSIKRA